MSRYAHLSNPDPELAAALAQLPKIEPIPLDVPTIRKFGDTAKKLPSFQSQKTQLEVKDWKVSVQDGEILVRTYVARPSGEHRNPLLVWAHGGGFVVGDLKLDEAMLQQLALDLELSIVNVGYRLAPEHRFPTGLKDTYEALKWAFLHAQELHAHPGKGFILGGNSAGGNFVAVLTHWARDDPLLRGKLTGQILDVPPVVHPDAVPEKYIKYRNELLSLEQNKDGPIMTKELMKFFFNQYGIKDPADPDVSPLLFPSHTDLPPAYFQICGLDPLRDEGLLYEKVLKEADVKTRLNIYPGVPHGFLTVFPTLKQVDKWGQDLRDGIRWILSGGTS